MRWMVSDQIHPTAVIGTDVELEADVKIGAYSVVEGPARIGRGSVIESHACVSGPIMMGMNNFIGHGAVLGKSPQHRGYRGEETWLRIGDDNIFREHVTIHRGTVEGGRETWIGNSNMFMVGSHVGHDAWIGDGCTLVNGALVAGHVRLHDGCILSGHAAVQQRVRVGRLAMLGGLGSTTKDVPPFVLQQGYNCVSGLNVVGLKRAGFSHETIGAIRSCFRIFYKEGRSLTSSLDAIEADWGTFPEVLEWVHFVRESKLGINPARGDSRVHRTF